MRKKITALLLTLILLFSFSGCDILFPGFVEYDVSGYIQALLDSSYRENHNEYILRTQSTSEMADENNRTTIENMAVNFCNMYNILPTEEQMGKIQEIMRLAYKKSKYTVKDEEKVSGGYKVDVEVSPLLNLSECVKNLPMLRDGIENGTYTIRAGNGDAVFNGSTDTTDLYVEEVIFLCNEALQGVDRYGSPVTITMNIKANDKGELFLDTMQLEKIDQTIVPLVSIE